MENLKKKKNFTRVKWGLDADLYQGVRVLVNFDIESKESWQEI